MYSYYWMTALCEGNEPSLAMCSVFGLHYYEALYSTCHSGKPLAVRCFADEISEWV